MLQRKNTDVTVNVPVRLCGLALRSAALVQCRVFSLAPEEMARRARRFGDGTASRTEVSNIFLLKGSDASELSASPRWTPNVNLRVRQLGLTLCLQRD